MHEVFGLFPTPLMRAPRVLSGDLVAGLIAYFSRSVALANSSSPNLVHTALLKPSDSPLLVQTAELLNPLLPEFGSLMFGERLGWSLKEMWVNVLDNGGRQAMHNHANSFISGVVYLTPTHPDSRTVFMRSPGGSEFTFKNDNAGVQTGAYNADKWISPAPEAGDVVLFPSYLMHAVPMNPGERRISLAFNAIPTHLDSWGYRVSFSG
jgi:putative 2-oxoglutarate-Fe(II)-dependent oxygenase superfamily protein